MRPLDQLGHLLHRDAEAPRLHLVGVAPRLSGADVELPGVPGTADDLAAADVVVMPGLVRQHEAGEIALAQAAAAMRTAVRQREELAAEVEHDDGAAVGADQLAAARRDFARGRDDVLFRHQSSRYSARALPE